MIEVATFAAGCFWAVEAAFRELKGVVDASVGYSGGHVKNPSYRDVCTGHTGHAESVQVKFDSSKVSYEKFLEVFWMIHDPTTLNRQGPDVGSQYRSIIFFHTARQKLQAEKSTAQLEKSRKFSMPIVTEIIPAADFYLAEEYHQRYIEKNPSAACHIDLQSIREL